MAWVVLSYAPAAWLPHWQWPQAIQPSFGLFALMGLAVFVVIQVWLVVATDRSLQAHPAGMQEFNLKRGVESVLTALPILITVLLAWAAWPRIEMLF